MFQPAEAWQPQFDPPLPPFRTYKLKSWFEEFAAALELNGIWLQAFMFESELFPSRYQPATHVAGTDHHHHGTLSAPLISTGGSMVSSVPVAPAPVTESVQIVHPVIHDCAGTLPGTGGHDGPAFIDERARCDH
ncbi:hypothetical protein HPB52_006392 [Rhipicephalus sanguineus]|uniref:Uncharacterized protein n=1 Tax=Rhipicephalus sanguineus TaxID=34632 RepID=A0A9D4PYJ5_RHISA|nr:hypothetical protein HPB52_006392 [Rhipicephalus sanguineus]